MRTFLITLLAGFIPCSFSLGACHLCGIIRIHISTVRDPVVLASGSGDPDHITHWLRIGLHSGLRICSSRIRRSIAGRTGILISGGRLCAGIRFISSRIIITGTLVPLDIASVADCDHRTLLISTKYLYSHIRKLIHGILMRMSVGITGAAADHCIFRNSLLEQIPGGGSGRTVMSRNDHIAGKIKSQITDRFLPGRFCIPGKKKMVISVLQPDRNRIVVIVATDRLRRKNRKFPASESKIRSGLRMLHS